MPAPRRWRLRRDAVQDMVRAITALNALMHDPQDVLRFTVGRIAVEPNTSNSVANRASFTIDFRHPDKDVLLARGDAVAGVVQAAVRDAGVTVQETFHALPVEFSPLVIDAVERGGGRAKLRTHAPAIGRVPRRAVRRAGVSDRDDFRPVPQGYQPQPSRILRAVTTGSGNARADADACRTCQLLTGSRPRRRLLGAFSLI